MAKLVCKGTKFEMNKFESITVMLRLDKTDNHLWLKMDFKDVDNKMGQLELSLKEIEKQLLKSLPTQAPKESQDNNIRIIKPKSLDAERKKIGVRQLMFQKRKNQWIENEFSIFSFPKLSIIEKRGN